MKQKWSELKTDPLKLGIVAIMFYLSFQIFADILSLKATSFFGLTLGAVFFVYPLTFTFRDIMHKVLGKEVAKLVIYTALSINVVMLGIFWIYVNMPVAEGSEWAQPASELIFGNIWRIVVASVVAEFISEMMDTELYQRWVNKWGEKHQWGRVLYSNTIAGPLDVILFNLIAFTGLWETSLILAVVKTEILLRICMAVVSIPLIYLVPTPKSKVMKAVVSKLK